MLRALKRTRALMILYLKATNMKNSNYYLTFKIGDDLYGMDIQHIFNIVEYRNIIKYPEMPPRILGLLKISDKTIPVIDSRLKFGIHNSENTIETSILITEIWFDNRKEYAGLLVDVIKEIVEIEKKEIKHPFMLEKIPGNEMISGIYFDSEKYISILSMDRALTQDDFMNTFRAKSSDPLKSHL